MWRTFPNEPPIKRFVRGHLYLICYYNQPNTVRVVEFKETKEHYAGLLSDCKIFIKVATRDYVATNNEEAINESRLKWHLIKEIKVEDLPLYVSRHTYQRFVELLRGEPRKTRTLSKSSLVISRRQEYESKRIAMELKSVK
jgi:hypothetical protein